MSCSPTGTQGMSPASNALRALIEEIDAVWSGIMTAMSTGVRFTALYAAWLVASLTEIRDVISVRAGLNVDEPKAQHQWQERQQKVISDQDEIILNVRRAAPERT
jgi:hypothetical protein